MAKLSKPREARLVLDREVYTLKEAHVALGVGVKVLRTAIQKKELPAFLPGNRTVTAPGRGMGYRIHAADLSRWYFGEAGK